MMLRARDIGGYREDKTLEGKDSDRLLLVLHKHKEG